MPSVPAEEFDFVIVGAGTAGCVLAARLSEQADVRVCLIEAGGHDRHPFIHIPAAVAAAIGTRAINWGFLTVPQPHLDGRRIPVPRGRVVGGSGSINGMVYFRGQPRDFDDWAAEGNEGWSWREVLPYFIRSECNPDYAGSPYHSTSGPMRVTHIRRLNPMNRAFWDAMASLGFARCDDFNGPNPEGYGPRQGTIRDGRRESTATAYLRPALKRSNLTVMTDTLAHRVAIEGGRAVGVDVERAGEARRIAARREVVLCGGTVLSPQLCCSRCAIPPRTASRSRRCRVGPGTSSSTHSRGAARSAATYSSRTPSCAAARVSRDPISRSFFSLRGAIPIRFRCRSATASRSASSVSTPRAAGASRLRVPTRARPRSSIRICSASPGTSIRSSVGSRSRAASLPRLRSRAIAPSRSRRARRSPGTRGLPNMCGARPRRFIIR